MLPHPHDKDSLQTGGRPCEWGTVGLVGGRAGRRASGSANGALAWQDVHIGTVLVVGWWAEALKVAR